jgi:sugar lactone lactonase YvrE
VLDVTTNRNSRVYLPSRVGTVVPVRGRDDAVVALEQGLYSINHDLTRLTPLLPLHGKATRLNDGKCDTAGRFWVRRRRRLVRGRSVALSARRRLRAGGEHVRRQVGQQRRHAL